MRIFKKSLACCLAVVLAVSAMVGCFVSAAETLSGTVTASNVEIKSDATSVEVPVEITAPEGVTEGTNDAMAIVRLKVTSEIGALTNVALAEDCSVYVQDVTLKDDVNTEDGIILIEAKDISKGFISAKIVLTFDVSKKAEDKTEYAVDVLGITDIEGANYNEIGYIFTYNDAVITVAPAECVEHDYQYTNNGEDHTVTCSKCDTYNVTEGHTYVEGFCACGAEEPVVDPNDKIAALISGIAIKNEASIQNVRGTAVYTAAQTKEIANAIKKEGGVITGMGVAMSYDGTDIKTSDSVYVSNIPVDAGTWNGLVSTGYPLTVYAEYKGMNFAQMDQEVVFAAYVTYTKDGVSSTVYGVEAASVFSEYLATATDADSVALKASYDLVQSATTKDVVESSVVSSDNGPTFKISYDLKSAYLRGTAVYTAAQTKAIANAIKRDGGVITGMGVMMSYDGTDVKTSDSVYVSNIPVDAGTWNGLVSTGYPLTVYAEYKGMNVAQFATDLEFIPFVYYTDADGAPQTMFVGEIQEGRFIDAIADDTTALGVAYTELYNSFNG